MKQIFKLREKLWVSLIIIAFAVLLVTPQLFTRKVILGSDSIFHYNRFYEAAMQLKNGNLSYIFIFIWIPTVRPHCQCSLRSFFCLFTRRAYFNKWHLVSLSDCVKGITTYTSMSPQCMPCSSSVKLRQILPCH